MIQTETANQKLISSVLIPSSKRVKKFDYYEVANKTVKMNPLSSAMLNLSCKSSQETKNAENSQSLPILQNFLTDESQLKKMQ